MKHDLLQLIGDQQNYIAELEEMVRKLEEKNNWIISQLVSYVSTADQMKLYFIMSDGLKKTKNLNKKKIFIVEASGHGSSFVRDADLKLLSLEDAKKDADHWVSHADTIGGQARVVNIETNEVVYNTQ
jgi:hypothetical protein